MFMGKVHPKYQASLDNYINSWKQEKAFVIGFQIRMGGNGDATFMTPDEVNEGIKCAMELAKVRNLHISKLKYCRDILM
jgi:hypothetical protein